MAVSHLSVPILGVAHSEGGVGTRAEQAFRVTGMVPGNLWSYIRRCEHTSSDLSRTPAFRAIVTPASVQHAEAASAWAAPGNVNISVRQPQEACLSLRRMSETINVVAELTMTTMMA